MHIEAFNYQQQSILANALALPAESGGLFLFDHRWNFQTSCLQFCVTSALTQQRYKFAITREMIKAVSYEYLKAYVDYHLRKALSLLGQKVLITSPDYNYMADEWVIATDWIDAKKIPVDIFPGKLFFTDDFLDTQTFAYPPSKFFNDKAKIIIASPDVEAAKGLIAKYTGLLKKPHKELSELEKLLANKFAMSAEEYLSWTGGIPNAIFENSYVNNPNKPITATEIELAQKTLYKSTSFMLGFMVSKSMLYEIAVDMGLLQPVSRGEEVFISIRLAKVLKSDWRWKIRPRQIDTDRARSLVCCPVKTTDIPLGCMLLEERADGNLYFHSSPEF